MLQRYHDTVPEGKHAFELLPAIDLRGGRVVRLLRGDFGAETVYADDPLAVARGFVTAGARWIHVVDLDGAAAGEPRQGALISAIVREAGEGTRVQVAGGLRDSDAVTAALDAGASRVVLGTAALADPAFAAAVVETHGPDRIVAALDVREGQAVGGGWLAGGPRRPVEGAMEAIASAGVDTFMVTAIARDGTLTGPDLAMLQRLVALDRGRVFASGGIGAVADIRRVRALGCAGAILGRALYEGRLSIDEALAAVR